VRLMLEPMRAQGRAQMFAQKFHAVALVAVPAQAHPNEMQVIGHQAIDGAKEAFPGGGVEHGFAEMRVEGGCQPTGSAPGDRKRPVNDSIAVVILFGQARQIKAAVHSRAGKGRQGFQVRFRWHGGMLEPAHAGCYEKITSHYVT